MSQIVIVTMTPPAGPSSVREPSAACAALLARCAQHPFQTAEVANPMRRRSGGVRELCAAFVFLPSLSTPHRAHSAGRSDSFITAAGLPVPAETTTTRTTTRTMRDA
jgi:hypothetical protein